MSASYSQPLRAALWLLLKLAIMGIVSAVVGYLLGWPVWKLVGLALVVSLLLKRELNRRGIEVHLGERGS